MSNHRIEIAKAFQETTLRPTPQRFAVLEHLVRHHTHSTAEEIFRAVNRADPRASLATVYNNLNALVRAGLVREVVSGGKAARYDASLKRHHHFVCERCGGVEDVPWFDVPAGAAILGSRTVKSVEVVFRGACPKCASGSEIKGESR